MTALWVFSDFVLFTFSIAAGASCLRSALGADPGRLDERRGPLELRPGTLGAVALCGFRPPQSPVFIAPDSASLKLVSELIAPGRTSSCYSGWRCPP